MEKTNTRTLVGVFAFCFGAMGSMLTMAVVGYIIASYGAKGVSPTLVTSLMTVPSLVGMIFAFFVGTLNKKVSTKGLVLFTQICIFIYCMVFLTLGGKVSIYVLLATAALAGFGMGANFTLLAAFMATAVPDPQKRATITGYASAAMNLSGVIFSTIGGKLAASGMIADPVNGWTKGYMLGFITLAAIVIELIFLPGGQYAQEGPAPEGGEKAKKSGVPAIVYAISIHYLVWFCFMYCYGLNISDYIINVYKLGDGGTAGIATAMVTVGGVIAGLFFGQYSKITKSMNCPIMMAMTAVGMLLCLIAPSVPGVIVGGFLCGFAMSGCNPYIMMLFGQICPPSQLTQAMSIFSGCMNVGMFVALYVINGLSSIIFGADYTLDKKFLLATIMCAICAVSGIFIYAAAAKQAAKNAAPQQ
ncbi:MAG: MFS transporter [Oscillospiraceae bacterium]|nr:MFS transporter [Oscillospiraceae bacterium]